MFDAIGKVVVCLVGIFLCYIILLEIRRYINSYIGAYNIVTYCMHEGLQKKYRQIIPIVVLANTIYFKGRGSYYWSGEKDNRAVKVYGNGTIKINYTAEDY